MSTPIIKPTVLPQWATQDQVDDVSLQNNVLTPPTQFMEYGFYRSEFPPRQWFNWLGRTTYNFLNWLNQQESQAIVATANSGNSYTAIIYNFSNLPASGAQLLLNIIDTATPANFYQAIGFAPQTVSGAITMTETASNTLSITTISTSGAVTVSGGTGPYIVYGQIKTIPS